MDDRTKGHSALIPKSDVNFIWKLRRKQLLLPFIIEQYIILLDNQMTESGEVERRVNQIAAVMYQITAFGFVKGRWGRKEYMVGVDIKGGPLYGAKTTPYYVNEMDYGSDGSLPPYWISPHQGQTIREYLDSIK
jgi:hypothetical protein